MTCWHCEKPTDGYLCARCISLLPTPLIVSVASGKATALDCERWLRERRDERLVTVEVSL